MDNSQFSEKIISEIKKGSIALKSRSHFVVKTGLIIVGILIVSLSALYFLSFALFILSSSGILFLPHFGMIGIMRFLSSLPWLLIGLGFIFVVILQILISRFAFVYHKPIIYTLAGLISIILISAFAVEQLKLHQFIMNRPMIRNGGIGKFYNSNNEPNPKFVHFGIIKNLGSEGFLMIERRGGEAIVIISDDTKLPSGKEFSIEEKVMVLGDKDNDNIIKAVGVEHLNEMPIRVNYREESPSFGKIIEPVRR